MTDRYRQLVNTPIGRVVTKQIGLPAPVVLERYTRGQPVISGPVLLGAARGSRLTTSAAAVLAAIGADVYTPLDDEARNAAEAAEVHATEFNAETAAEDDTFKALVFDASGISSSAELSEAWAFLHPAIRRVRRSGRVIVLATVPEDCRVSSAAVAQRALEGLVRAVGKEVGHGATAQLVYVAAGAEDRIESTLRFFLSPKSAYVSGQVVHIGTAQEAPDGIDWQRPLAEKVALVTGAARGIGESIATVLARDGAHVVGVDLPQQGEELAAVTRRLGGSLLTLDITDDGAPVAITDHVLQAHGGVDVVVHNAGVTADKALGRMTEELWSAVIDVNLTAPQRIDEELFARKAVREHGSVVLVSSISGIAGNAGQSNYSTSKAGVIGIVEAFAPVLSKRGVTLNAVAPGFIETQMTEAMPIALREAGRRMNSLSQGGQPIDVAETIAWLANPASAGVTGNVVRVCGQSLIGA